MSLSVRQLSESFQMPRMNILCYPTFEVVSILKRLHSGIWALDLPLSSKTSCCLYLTKQTGRLNSGTTQLIIRRERIHFQPC